MLAGFGSAALVDEESVTVSAGVVVGVLDDVVVELEEADGEECRVGAELSRGGGLVEGLGVEWGEVGVE